VSALEPLQVAGVLAALIALYAVVRALAFRKR
jgi:hypothetical protein